MTKRIYILNEHPAETFLNAAFAEAYAQAARDAGHEVRTTHLNQMTFDMDFGLAVYTQTKPLEPVLEDFLTDLE